jgi:hypothetical protein
MIQRLDDGNKSSELCKYRFDLLPFQDFCLADQLQPNGILSTPFVFAAMQVENGKENKN